MYFKQIFKVDKDQWVDVLFRRIIIQNGFQIMKIIDNTFVKQFHFFSRQYKKKREAGTFLFHLYYDKEKHLSFI